MDDITFAQNTKKTFIEWKGKNIEVIDDEISIRIKNNASISEFTNIIDSLGFQILVFPDEMGIAILKLNSKFKIIDAIETLRKINSIENAAPIVTVHALVTPNDTYYNNQWGLAKIGATSAWAVTTGSADVKIGILDSGIPMLNNSLSHPDLQSSARIILGNDYINDGDGVKDKYGHGTHVAGIASAETNNNTGISGVSWNTKLIIEKVLDFQGSGNSYSVYEGVVDAVVKGAKVINLSFGSTTDDPLFESAILYARSHNNGVLLVIAAGNYDQLNNPNKIVEYPAAYSTTYDNVIAVSATTSTDVLADYSSTGPEITVSAPGDNIYSTLPNYQVTLNLPPYSFQQNYDNDSGTSMAAPFVSGLAGLILSKYSSLTPAQIRQAIELSAVDLGTTGFDNLYGYGRINADKALHSLYVPQEFSTIQVAITAATSGQTIYVTGSQTLSSNLTVPSGITLTIKSGATISLNGYSITTGYTSTSSGGTISEETGVVVNGLTSTLFDSNNNIKGLFGGTIQAAINVVPSITGQSQYLKVSPGVHSGNVTASNIINLYISSSTGSPVIIQGNLSFSNCQGLNLYLISASSLYLNNCPISILRGVDLNLSGGQGLSVYNCMNLSYSGGEITVSGGYGCTINTASGLIFNNDYELTNIYGNGWGIWTRSGSSVQVTNGYFCSNSYDDLIADAGTTIQAMSCYFKNASPKTSGSGVSTASNQTNGYCTGLMKIADNPSSNTSPILSDPNFAEFTAIENKHFDLISRSSSIKAGTENFNSEYQDIANNYTDFINKYPNSVYSKTAMTSVVQIYEMLSNYNGINTFLQNQLSTKQTNTNLLGLAKRFMIDYYRGVKDFQSALIQSNTIINDKTSDVDLLCDALFNKGLIYSHDLNKPDSANECFSSIIKNYPSSNIVSFAEKELGLLGVNVENLQKESISSNSAKLNYRLENYPNPFNPTTNIKYQLPKNGFVTLKVYDILGREVATLVNENQQAGSYSVLFDASKLASGIYIYTIHANDFVQSKKMNLVK
jgi:subtilisin family serine protease/tetratricopeptide (TPR) repeat protein